MSVYIFKDSEQFRRDVKKIQEGKSFNDLKEITGLSISTINSFCNKGAYKIKKDSVKGYFKLFKEINNESASDYAERFTDPNSVKILLIDNGRECVIQDIPETTDEIITYLENVLSVNSAAPVPEYRVLIKGDNCMQVKRQLPDRIYDNQLYACNLLTVLAFKSMEEEIKEISKRGVNRHELVLLIHSESRQGCKEYKGLKNVTIIELIVDQKKDSVKRICCLRRNSDVHLGGIFLEVYENMLRQAHIPMLSKKW